MYLSLIQLLAIPQSQETSHCLTWNVNKDDEEKDDYDIRVCLRHSLRQLTYDIINLSRINKDVKRYEFIARCLRICVKSLLNCRVEAAEGCTSKKDDKANLQQVIKILLTSPKSLRHPYKYVYDVIEYDLKSRVY